MSNQKIGRRGAIPDALRIQTLNSQSKTGAAGSAVSHSSLSGLGADDHTQYMHISTARTVTAQHQFAPSLAQAPFSLGANAQGQLVTGLYADQLSKSVIAGAGLTGGGALTADRTLAVGAGLGLTVNADDVALTTPGTLSVSSSNSSTGSHTHAITSSAAPGGTAKILATTAAGLLTLQELAVTTVSSDLIPGLTDTYDLGSSQKLWRKGYLSEMDAVLFAESTIALVGGWFIIGHDQGSLPADVAAADTTIDFGEAMIPNDFLEFRAALKVEYIKVLTLVGGTTYNVTRNLDGTGANDWPAGTPYLVLGNTGDGRIELNAYDTPRISMVTQGATYNAQTELLRIGDLDTNWGYVAPTYGLAIGEYASGVANIVIDSTNGLRLRSYTTTILQMNSNGIAIASTTGSSYQEPNAYKFTSGGSSRGGLYSRVQSSILNDLALRIPRVGSQVAQLWITTDADNTVSSNIYLEAYQQGATGAAMHIYGYEQYIDFTKALYVAVGDGSADVTDLRVAGGLYVGSIATDPVAGKIYIEAAANPQLKLNIAGSSSYATFYNSAATQSLIQHVTASGSGAADLLLDAAPLDGSSVASIRLFRVTNTSGRASLDILLGTASATQNHSFAGTGDSYVCVNNGFFGIGKNNPSYTLDVTGNIALSNILCFTVEISDPIAPDANQAKVYIRDNGSGKTQLCVRFATGAVQVIATEP